MSAAWRITDHGLRIMIRLTPKGGRDALDGTMTVADGHVVVKARVRAAPESGEANAAIIALIANTLGIAKSDAVLAAGHTSRLKTLDIRGDGAALAVRLAAALEGHSA